MLRDRSVAQKMLLVLPQHSRLELCWSRSQVGCSFLGCLQEVKTGVYHAQKYVAMQQCDMMPYPEALKYLEFPDFLVKILVSRSSIYLFTWVFDHLMTFIDVCFCCIVWGTFRVKVVVVLYSCLFYLLTMFVLLNLMFNVFACWRNIGKGQGQRKPQTKAEWPSKNHGAPCSQVFFQALSQET